MKDVFIAGTGMTAFGKFDRSIRSLSEEAVAEALRDAGMTPGDVEMAFFGNAVGGILTGQEMIRGQAALRHTGILGVPIVSVENACASASSAFYLACMAVSSGAVDIALAVGAEKLTHPDKARSFAAIGTAVDLDQLGPGRDKLLRKLLAALPDDGLVRREESRAPKPSGGGRSPFMDIYAANTRQLMERTGATAEDFALVAAKNHGNGALNPKAQYGSDVTAEDVLNSREVSPPLTLLMCSPIGDGSAAVVVASEEAVRRFGCDAVRIRSTVLISGRDRVRGDKPAVQRAAEQAYEQAGVGPEDLDVCEVHDAAAPAELIIYGELGLCEPSDAPKLIRAGDTAIGGRIPVNPSGGLTARGHPIGATGCAQLVELADQLRGRCGDRQVAGARIGLAENAGGFLDTDPAAAVVTVLSV